MWKFWLNKGGLPCKSALWLFSEPFRVLWLYGYYGVLQKLLWFHCGPVWPSIIISFFRRKQICAAEERGTNRGCVSGTQTINYSSESQEAESEKRMFSKKHHRWNRRVRKNEGWARWHCLPRWLSGWNESPEFAVVIREAARGEWAFRRGASPPCRSERASCWWGLWGGWERAEMSRRRGFSSSEEEEDASTRPPRQHKGATQFAARWSKLFLLLTS